MGNEFGLMWLPVDVFVFTNLVYPSYKHFLMVRRLPPGTRQSTFSTQTGVSASLASHRGLSSLLIQELKGTCSSDMLAGDSLPSIL